MHGFWCTVHTVWNNFSLNCWIKQLVYRKYIETILKKQFGLENMFVTLFTKINPKKRKELNFLMLCIDYTILCCFMIFSYVRSANIITAIFSVCLFICLFVFMWWNWRCCNGLVHTLPLLQTWCRVYSSGAPCVNVPSHGWTCPRAGALFWWAAFHKTDR